MPLQSFIGNSKVTERLGAKLRENRFPHALIFAGPEGVGKHTMALMLAKALNCINEGPSDFCDECSHCRKINAGTHPDVMTVTVEEEATQIKIVQIRQVLTTLEMQPLEGKNKVFIIDPANFLNAEAANALLKGLEEPPENSFFLLLCVNLHELLLTIRSRSQVYHFAPLSLEEIRARGVTDELKVRWSQGSIGRAQNLDLAALRNQREAVLDFFDAAVNAKDETLRDMLGASADLARSRQDFEGYLNVMAVLLRDLLHLSENMPDQIVNIDIRARLERMAASASTERWVRVSEFLKLVENGVKGHWNRQLMTDNMALLAAEISDDNPAKSR